MPLPHIVAQEVSGQRRVGAAAARTLPSRALESESIKHATAIVSGADAAGCTPQCVRAAMRKRSSVTIR
eukprot:3932436-Rhodomonas_salina.1